MPWMTPKRLVKIIDKVLADYCAMVNTALEGTDAKAEECFKDVRVTAEKDHVLVTYDGAGYDFLSYESRCSRDGVGPRKTIADKIKPHKMFIEDRNSWSFHIYMP